MDKTKKKAQLMICISIGLMLISMIVASLIQSNGGKVTIKDLFWETDEGVGMSALLFVPRNATVENPAPAIVTSHGAYNNREMQDANLVELARRGFVVLSIDRINQGLSDIIGTNGIRLPNAGTVWSGVTMLSRLPYVDVNRIGVTGHSAGGGSCNSAVVADNENGTRLIAAVLLNSADATYIDRETQEFVNIYGTRSVGIIQCKYDEFFHKTTGPDGNTRSAPYFLDGPNSQSFLYFGTNPAGRPPRNSDTVYTERIGGRDVIRVIYQPAIIHPWSHFSTQSTRATIEFFEMTLGAPNPLPARNQVWNIKEAFNFVGLIGLVMFIINFAILLCFTPTFASLRAEEVVQPYTVDKKGKIWFWGTLAAGAIFAMLVYLPIVFRGVSATYVPQQPPYGISLWAAACGLFAIVCMIAFYFFYGKKNGVDLAARGVKISLPKLGKSVLLAVIVISVSYTWVFFADFFFKTDFRIWVLAFKVFNPRQLFIAMFPYAVLFLVYYVASSVANNCFNYNDIGGKRSWVNTLIVSLFAGAPAIILLSIQYFTFFITNEMAWVQVSGVPGNPPMYILWLFPMLLILPFAAVISRAIYKVTRNPYIAGIISGILVAIISCANTTTRFLG